MARYLARNCPRYNGWLGRVIPQPKEHVEEKTKVVSALSY